ncbi:hypothetical protein [Roseovarius mucosus]|uniref:hypothetical protein n=1 Tax=Roseovarius mucosus TaxID=215743 RepID=UPI003BA8F142
MTAYGPAEIGSVLQGVGALAGAFAVGFAAWLASNTFEQWRKQKLSERHIEQAERILTATYKARRALERVRNPMMWAHELHAAREHLETQDFWASTPENRRQKMVTAQGYYNRLNAVLDERRALDECLPISRALFGEPLEQALETLHTQFHLVSIAVDANSWDGNDREFQRSISEDLSSLSGVGKANKMNGVIAEQIKVIEDACVPVLRLEGGN